MPESVKRCGRVALMGPPNAGKSTLVNAMIGQKITIVTPKPQTTRTQIVGILSEGDMQAIFLDTPGIAQTRGRLSKAMVQAVWQSLAAADIIMLMLDCDLYIRHPEFLEKDTQVAMRALREENRPVIVVVNKVDLFSDKSKMLPLLEELHDLLPKAEIFPLSAVNKDGIAELKKLIHDSLPKGDFVFPEDQVSTAPVRFMAAEIIREKLFLHLRQEVPYSVHVNIENWEEIPEHNQTIINAVIYVARPSHKAMVIGRGGSTLKEIGTQARKEICDLIEGKVHLELWVKVRENWSEDMTFLQDMGILTE